MTTASSRPALRLAAASGVDLGAPIDAFLSQPDLAATTRAKYRQTLAVVEDELGDGSQAGPSPERPIGAHPAAGASDARRLRGVRPL